VGAAYQGLMLVRARQAAPRLSEPEHVVADPLTERRGTIVEYLSIEGSRSSAIGVHFVDCRHSSLHACTQGLRRDPAAHEGAHDIVTQVVREVPRYDCMDEDYGLTPHAVGRGLSVAQL